MIGDWGGSYGQTADPTLPVPDGSWLKLVFCGVAYYVPVFGTESPRMLYGSGALTGRTK